MWKAKTIIPDKICQWLHLTLYTKNWSEKSWSFVSLLPPNTTIKSSKMAAEWKYFGCGCRKRAREGFKQKGRLWAPTPHPQGPSLWLCQTLLWFVMHSSTTFAGEERLRDDLKELLCRRLLQAVSWAIINIIIYFFPRLLPKPWCKDFGSSRIF